MSVVPQPCSPEALFHQQLYCSSYTLQLMNNSYSQTERQEPKINTNADRAAFGHRPCVSVFVFAALSLHSVCLICVCALVLMIVYLVLLCCIKLMLLTIISIMTTLFSLQTKLFFPPLLLDCRKNAVSLQFRPAD